MRRPALYLAPVLVAIAVVVAPLALGRETLFLRDVFQTHLPMRAALARGLAQGSMPVLDPSRGGGQPLAGNPNAAPWYPSPGLLALGGWAAQMGDGRQLGDAADGSPAAGPGWRQRVLWGLNAHLWLHWLLAPLAMAWLARRLGLSAAAAAVAATVWAMSGYVQSQLAFVNLIPAVTLAPALLAAVLATAEQPPGARRVRAAALAGALWGLIILGGDPLLAAYSALAALGLWLVVGVRRAAGEPMHAAWRRAGLGLLVIAGLAGTLLALPQIGEAGRIVPTSFRAVRGYSPTSATVASFDPRQALEWLVPFAFGEPSAIGGQRFWGYGVYTDWLPYYATLYPGLLALVLLVAAWRGTGWRPARWCWGLIALGLLLALGRFNPLAAPLFTAFGGVLRYPIKAWLLVGLGATLLAGYGSERLLAGEPGSLRRLRWAGLGLLAGCGGLLAWLTFAPTAAARVLARWMAAGGPLEPLATGTPSPSPSAVAGELTRWHETLALGAAGLLVAGLLLLAARRRPASSPLAVVVALAVHAATQLVLLAPARPTDLLRPYTVTPPLAALLPESARVVHVAAARRDLTSLATGRYPEDHLRWLERRAFHELHPFAGALFEVRYELNPSPEGLDSFLARLAGGLFEQASIREQARLLRIWGVTHVIEEEPPGGELVDAFDLVARLPSFGGEVVLWRLRQPLPEVAWRTRILFAADVGAAGRLLTSADFDPEHDVVVPGVAAAESAGARALASGSPRVGEGQVAEDEVRDDRAHAGRVEVSVLADERIEVVVESETPGMLVVQRAHQPLWRASIDGASVATTVGDLYRLAVAVPAGRHRVALRVDRAPLERAARLAWVGVVLLAAGLLIPGVLARGIARG